MNSVWLEGKVVADSEPKIIAGGKSVSNFKIAVNHQLGERKLTAFLPVVAWKMDRPLKKGTRVRLAGYLQTRSWESKDGKKNYTTEVVSEEIYVLEGYEEKPDIVMSEPPPIARQIGDLEIPF